VLVLLYVCASGRIRTVKDEQISTADLELVSQWLKDAERIVVFTGAGISTDSGIPDFRGPNGLWTKNPLAEKTSTLSYYLNDPEVRKVAWEGRVQNFNGTAQPNDGHRALVTQNVDGLHQDSGIEPVNVVEVHGTIKFGRCWECKDRRPMKYFIERVIAGEEDPHCELCGGVVKSDAILFEQALVPEVIDRAFDEAGRCDVLLAVGSTLAVGPANQVVPRAKAGGAKVVIVNGDTTHMDGYAHVLLRGSISPVLQALVAGAGFLT
jgi:NAD-dependent deacetylase